MSVTTEVTAVVTSAGTVPVPSAAAATAGAATAGAAGAVYRIAPDGVWDSIWRSAEDTPYDVVADAGGGVLIGTGGRGKVFRVSGAPPRTVLVTRAPAQQVTSFAAGPDGDLYYATANPARLYRLAPELADEGHYLSEVRDAGTVATWGALRWRARSPGRSTVRLFTRSGNTATPGETWSNWSEPYTNGEGTPIASPKARYLQWKATLRGSDAPSRRADAPRAACGCSAGPALGHHRLPSAQPAPRSDRGHGAPAGGGVPGNVRERPAARRLRPLAPATTDGRRAAQGRTGSRRCSGAGCSARDSGPSPGRPRTATRTGCASSSSTVRRTPPNWRVLARQLAGTIFTWDTTSVPDGTYEVRVDATDALSNPPGGALGGVLASPPFDIDNTPPEIAFGPTRPAGGTTVVTIHRHRHALADPPRRVLRRPRSLAGRPSGRRGPGLARRALRGDRPVRAGGRTHRAGRRRNAECDHRGRAVVPGEPAPRAAGRFSRRRSRRTRRARSTGSASPACARRCPGRARRRRRAPRRGPR